jgi:NPCBM/NEW2 domain
MPHSPAPLIRLLLSAFLLLAETAALLPARAAEAAIFEVRRTSGKPARGSLTSLNADWSVVLEKGGKVSGDEVISIRRMGVALPPLPTDEQLILANGDRLPVRDVKLDGEKLLFTHPDLSGGMETGVPLAAVLVYWRAPIDRTAQPEKLRHRLVRAKRPRDTVLLKNGDSLEGTLNALDGKSVEVEVDKKVRSAGIHQVAAVALSTDLADRLTPKGAYAHIVLSATEHSPGGRLTLLSAQVTDGVLRGKTAFGAIVRVPVERVLALDVFNGKTVSLADMKPSKYEYVPYLDEQWPWTLDGTVTGGDLRLGGSSYSRGIGMHSTSRLTWKLDGDYTRFEAVVGLDDRDGAHGSVRIRVLADGKPIEGSTLGPLTHQDGPRTLSVNIASAKELTLEVDHGAGGPVQDVVDWVDVRLVK